MSSEAILFLRRPHAFGDVYHIRAIGVHGVNVHEMSLQIIHGERETFAVR